MLKLGDLMSLVRQEMIIDRKGRIWSDKVVIKAINDAMQKLIGDVRHIFPEYAEIDLKNVDDETKSLFSIHENCIIAYASYLLFSQPGDQRNYEKAQLKYNKYEEELRVLFQKIIIEDI